MDVNLVASIADRGILADDRRGRRGDLFGLHLREEDIRRHFGRLIPVSMTINFLAAGTATSGRILA